MQVKSHYTSMLYCMHERRDLMICFDDHYACFNLMQSTCNLHVIYMYKDLYCMTVYICKWGKRLLKVEGH